MFPSGEGKGEAYWPLFRLGGVYGAALSILVDVLGALPPRSAVKDFWFTRGEPCRGFLGGGVVKSVDIRFLGDAREIRPDVFLSSKLGKLNRFFLSSISVRLSEIKIFLLQLQLHIFL